VIRAAPAAIVGWAATHGISPGRLYVSLDAALREVCERLVEAGAVVRVDPEPETGRRPDGTVAVRSPALGLDYLITCRFQPKAATFSDLMPATVPI
jgi:hypothetical protein